MFIIFFLNTINCNILIVFSLSFSIKDSQFIAQKRNILKRIWKFLRIISFKNSNYNLKTEAKSGVVRKNDYIKISLKFVDKNLNTLYSTSISFENNLIPKRLHKNFVNISPKKLENKFNSAKSEICKEIMKEYAEKKKELNDKIDNLKKYCQIFEGVIPSEFRGIQIEIDKGHSAKWMDTHTAFEMWKSNWER